MRDRDDDGEAWMALVWVMLAVALILAFDHDAKRDKANDPVRVAFAEVRA